MQDEITEAVTIAIAPAIADAERQRAVRKPPANLDAWAAYQRGLWHMGKANSEDYASAEEFFQKAIDLDPNITHCRSRCRASYSEDLNPVTSRDLPLCSGSCDSSLEQTGLN